jgi:hypothetical protein
MDEDDEPITSCVVIPVETSAVPIDAHGSGRRRLPNSAKIGLRALEKAIQECGEPAPASTHIPPGVRAATVETWRRYAYEMGISSSGEARAQQKAFKAAYDRLVGDEVVAVWSDQVWIHKPERT